MRPFKKAPKPLNPEPQFERCPVFLMNGDSIVDVFDMPARGDLKGTTRHWTPSNRVDFLSTGAFDRVVWEGPAGCYEIRMAGVEGSLVSLFPGNGWGVPFERCNHLNQLHQEDQLEPSTQRVTVPANI